MNRDPAVDAPAATFEPHLGPHGPRGRGELDFTGLSEAEAAARRSEERLRLTVEGATDYAILTLPPGRALTSWSPGAEATFGWPAAEMLGRSGDELFTPEDRAAGAPEREAGQAVREGRAADERWHVRKDGGRFWASGVSTAIWESHSWRRRWRVERTLASGSQLKSASGQRWPTIASISSRPRTREW